MNQPTGDEPILCFPCFILQSANQKGFVYHDLDDANKAVPILTDDDLMDRHRKGTGLGDRPAYQFNTARELLAHLELMPDAITHIVLDPPIEFAPKLVTAFPIDVFKDHLARKIDL